LTFRSIKQNDDAVDWLNYHHLRYFWAVARHGNLTRASRALRVSQSAVSSQIQQLEEHLGHALFERVGKQLVLTEAGRIALDHADTIFALGDDLLGTLRARGTPTRQMVRIGALSTLSRNFQLAFLSPLLRRPDVELVLRSGRLTDLLQGLEDHQLDIVLSNIEPHRTSASKWVSHSLSEQSVSLVGHPRYATDSRKLKTLLANEPLILPTVESSIRSGFDALVARLDVRPQIAAEVDDMAMLRLLAREDLGLAVVPPIVVQGELKNNSLVEVRSLPELKESFLALTLSRRFPNPLVQLLVTDRKLGD
jgi:LysR family transcriptional activator of nhaA